MSSAPLSLSEQLAVLRGLIQGSHIIRYTNLSAWMLLIWDHIISLEQEVEYIWRGKKKLSNVIYVLLRYVSPVVVTFNVFSVMQPPPSNQLSCPEIGVVVMHMSSWPLLVINGVAECVMAARVVVLWDNSRWVIAIVSAAWLLGVGGTCVLLAERIEIYSKATSLSLPSVHFWECILPPETDQLEFWKMWLILLGYNTLLGVLACAKGISTYRRKMRRQSHPPLLQIIVRGSLDYYLVIIALNIAMLLLWRYGDVFLFSAGSGMTLPITVILACRLILHLRQAYYGPSGDGTSHVKLPMISSVEVRSGPTASMTSERIPLRQRTMS